MVKFINIQKEKLNFIILIDKIKEIKLYYGIIILNSISFI
jgi:hypothetical protein